MNQNFNYSFGSVNSTLYFIASFNYGYYHHPGCNSSIGNLVADFCIFYDVTQGDMDVPCYPLNGMLYNCYRPSGDTYGVLSTSNTSLAPAYGTVPAWDFATGIGTVNVQNLIAHWPFFRIPPVRGE